MENIRNYLLSIIAAAIICSIITRLSENRGAQSKIIKLLCGVFLGITVISPLVELRIDDLNTYISDITLDGQDAVNEGTQIRLDALSESIKSNVEAYILDKAVSLGLELDVEVTLNEDEPPLPDSVSLTGKVSPFSKRNLTEYIEENLGIPEGRQLWN